MTNIPNLLNLNKDTACVFLIYGLLGKIFASMFHLLIFAVLLVLSTDSPIHCYHLKHHSEILVETPKICIRLIFAGDGAKFFHILWKTSRIARRSLIHLETKV